MGLAKHWPIEIINMDSATIYKEMDIGSAKPSREEQLKTKHHLLDIIDPVDSYSAASFCSDTLALLSNILERKKIPIIVGGTMMYYKSLREGIDDLPTSNQAIRQIIEEQASKNGWPSLHNYLKKIDPTTANRIGIRDKQRIQRSLEVFFTTGKPLSSLLKVRDNQLTNKKYKYITISLEPSNRSALHDRITKRFNIMMKNGLLEEVYSLFKRGDLNTTMPSIRCVGYRQLWEYFEEKNSLEFAVEKSIIATRQLAKKQMTWLRSQPERIIIDCLDQNYNKKTIDALAPIVNNNYKNYT
ncbi:tRNA (adenosine(37)-N6)-dimethylallyltransferase MiaA [Candidatus Kinetoplastidibacterium crithidiae]|uniref:tRNA (adenosine(37)-N6)-dimethylallyltransferase MiaA n=1 Tax=Candidatus Kinetoplastidibacterium crithidiae TaxID=33056 RepID=UPI001CEF91D9|nr:tRNA (adenosine(37)-N6)-dimethylallyltransferase MiaA [Candidatus Kinetoplastibacterium crithidii]